MDKAFVNGNWPELWASVRKLRMEDQDMERTYYAINEQTARAAKHLNSFCDYTAESAIEEYKRKVDWIYDVVESIKKERPHLVEKAVNMADRYSRKLAGYYNDY